MSIEIQTNAFVVTKRFTTQQAAVGLGPKITRYQAHVWGNFHFIITSKQVSMLSDSKHASYFNKRPNHLLNQIFLSLSDADTKKQQTPVAAYENLQKCD